MTRIVATSALLCILAIAGCHYASGVGFAESMPSGMPDYEPGFPEGYWIWQDRHGWHLRTTSDVPRHFRGFVQTLGGAPSSIRAVGGAEGAVRQDGSYIDFEYDAAGGEQGFDWTSSSGCNVFDVTIDGTSRPLRVFLGWDGQSPARVPFAVCG